MYNLYRGHVTPEESLTNESFNFVPKPRGMRNDFELKRNPADGFLIMVKTKEEDGVQFSIWH